MNVTRDVQTIVINSTIDSLAWRPLITDQVIQVFMFSFGVNSNILKTKISLLEIFMKFLLLVGLVLTIGCGNRQLSWETVKQQIRNEFPEVEHISIAEFEQNLAETSPDKLLIVDVREPKEFAVSHLQDAVNLQNAEAILTLAQAQHVEMIVLYCSVGYRSARMAQLLEDHGWDQVVNLEGSIFEWANSARPVFSGQDPVTAVHPFDRVWGQLLDRQYHPK